MPYPSVAIVGRPNVGKSTLFNALVGSRIAIEADTPGATRDRILYPLTVEDRTFDLVDTGGIGLVDQQRLESQVEEQIERAIRTADLLLFLVDSRDGPVPQDHAVAARVRAAGHPVILVAAKVDTDRLEQAMPSFHELGFGDPVAVSAKQLRGLGDLEEAILAHLPPLDPDSPDGFDNAAHPTFGLLKIALLGRRNVGKSTLVNQLCGAERVLVSDLPGTTRDSVDIVVERDGEKFVVIDTAGLRKPGQRDDALEFFGHLRAERALRRADVVVLMLDATEEIGRVDKRIGARILEEAKPAVIALNKWDLVREKNPGITVDDFQRYVADRLPGLYFCPVAALSAKTGQNAWNLVAKARDLAGQAAQTVKTGALNAALVRAQERRATKVHAGRHGRIYYGTQVSASPPTFLLFVNNPAQFDDQYQRYLGHQLREALGFPEVPVKLLFKISKEKKPSRYQ